jgi:hypothetical protein
MKDSTLDRRGALAMLGVAFAGAVTVRSAHAAGVSSDTAAKSEAAKPAAQDAPVPAIPVGLAAGAYRVSAVGPVAFGAFHITLANETGDTFVVDVCSHDAGPAALTGPAHTNRLDLFLINEGGGSSPTHEPHGLAAMALAEALKPFEAQLADVSLLTMRERLSQHGTGVLTPIPG